ncbi:MULTISPECIES: tetratricopeptide repeat-containing serine protease family protein [Trichocoleus]|uniref:Tetratricopeptide repeat-containing serine protease family protein n=1 Tax=Trichocoleus desertorum GB2-A4 TaxID=2933944 RepID=A0ABV0JDY7_9CYAN|nr:tetratricopeptide repeat-containing serine protease family protein [Trichocoleus sp. FACHB-46]MBD1865174.1 serine protease [Trichocoleus sp. FACHB-46]
MMNLKLPRFNLIVQLMTGVLTTAVILSNVTTAFAKSTQEIVELAKPVTVQINGDFDDSTGIIIAKKENRYLVLTTSHGLEKSPKHTIHTHNGKTYPMTVVYNFRQSQNPLDLALVEFTSSDLYPVATLGDSNQSQVSDPVYAYGYPDIGGQESSSRSAQFTGGSMTSRTGIENSFLHTAATWGGMSGGAMFDTDGRVIGVIQANLRGLTQGIGPEVEGGSTPFNQAIAINAFTSAMPLSAPATLSAQDLIVDRSIPVIRRTKAHGFFVQGMSAYSQGDALSAINSFSQSLQSDPKYADAYFGRALAYAKFGNYTNAIEDWSSVVRLEPKYIKAYFNRGLIRYRTRDFANAIADYTQAIKIDSSDPLLFVSRGVAYYKANDGKQAISDFSEAVKLDPKYAEAFYRRGEVHSELQDKRAIDDYTRAIQLKPDYASAYFGRGYARCSLTRDRSGALSDFQTAVNFYQAQGKISEHQQALDNLNRLQRQPRLCNAQ